MGSWKYDHMRRLDDIRDQMHFGQLTRSAALRALQEWGMDYYDACEECATFMKTETPQERYCTGGDR